jgi:hypothetical protein
MSQNFRIRYSMKLSGQHSDVDVQTMDVQSELDQLLDHLPAGAYIMYIEDLIRGQNIHWTRWPKSYRPGFGVGA